MKSMWSARSCCLMLLLVSAVALGGCWSARELNKLAIVMAVGIDKADEPGRYLVTAQIARPGTAASGVGGAGATAGGGDETVHTTYADGDTLFAAIRNLAQFASRRIYWAHNNVVVIGEDVAREDITPVLDFFARNPELRLRAWLAIARDTTAREIVSAKTGIESVPANSLAALFFGLILGRHSGTSSPPTPKWLYQDCDLPNGSCPREARRANMGVFCRLSFEVPESLMASGSSASSIQTRLVVSCGSETTSATSQ